MINSWLITWQLYVETKKGNYMLNIKHELPRMVHELSLMRNYMANYMAITC